MPEDPDWEVPEKSKKPVRQNISPNTDLKLYERRKSRRLLHKTNKIDFDPVELDEALKCSVCSTAFNKNTDFALHSKEHSEVGNYSCHFCTYQTTCKYRVVAHVRMHEGTARIYKCELCPKTFKKSTYAYEHKYFHSGEKPFQCEICGKHFMYSKALAYHRRCKHYEIVTGKPLRKFDCETCNKHYESQSGLLRHNSMYHRDPNAGGGLSVLCDICGKSLSCKYKLKLHLRTHTGYKPFCCHYCSKTFTNRDQVISHERVHTGEKPYTCQHCGKSFAQSAPFRYHVKTHTGERKYVCQLCNKRFISKSNMRIHLNTCNIVKTEIKHEKNRESR